MAWDCIPCREVIMVYNHATLRDQVKNLEDI